MLVSGLGRTASRPLSGTPPGQLLVRIVRGKGRQLEGFLLVEGHRQVPVEEGEGPVPQGDSPGETRRGSEGSKRARMGAILRRADAPSLAHPLVTSRLRPGGASARRWSAAGRRAGSGGITGVLGLPRDPVIGAWSTGPQPDAAARFAGGWG